MPNPLEEVFVRFYQRTHIQYALRKYEVVPKNSQISSLGGVPFGHEDVIVFTLSLKYPPLGHFVFPRSISIEFIPLALIHKRKVFASIPAPEGAISSLGEYLEEFDLVD